MNIFDLNHADVREDQRAPDMESRIRRLAAGGAPSDAVDFDIYVSSTCGVIFGLEAFRGPLISIGTKITRKLRKGRGPTQQLFVLFALHSVL